MVAHLLSEISEFTFDVHQLVGLPEYRVEGFHETIVLAAVLHDIENSNIGHSHQRMRRLRSLNQHMFILKRLSYLLQH